MRLHFEVPGQPQGKGRPRFVRATGRAYTPAKTESYEATVRLFASQAMAGRGLFEARQPLMCLVEARFAVPASWSKRKQAQAHTRILHPTGKPDCDNILKVLGDALNGVVWHDDAQVVLWTCQKVYGDAPGLEVEVRPMPVGNTKES